MCHTVDRNTGLLYKKTIFVDFKKTFLWTGGGGAMAPI